MYKLKNPLIDYFTNEVIKKVAQHAASINTEKVIADIKAQFKAYDEQKTEQKTEVLDIQSAFNAFSDDENREFLAGIGFKTSELWDESDGAYTVTKIETQWRIFKKGYNTAIDSKSTGSQQQINADDVLAFIADLLTTKK